MSEGMSEAPMDMCIRNKTFFQDLLAMLTYFIWTNTPLRFKNFNFFVELFLEIHQ